MSSILLSSPFPAPPLSHAPTTAATAEVSVAPVSAAITSGNAGDATSFSGSNAGTGGSRQGDTIALFQNNQNSKWERPAIATGRSIVNAQTQNDAQVFPFDTNLPKVAMPDPLPTSPFLKQTDTVA